MPFRQGLQRHMKTCCVSHRVVFQRWMTVKPMRGGLAPRAAGARVGGTIDESAGDDAAAEGATVYEVPEEVHARNAELVDELRERLILAPLTRGGHVAFRQLCRDFGCEVTMSEMAFARPLLKGDRVERARLYKAGEESCFGFQIATNVIDEGVRAAHLAAEGGARWLDLNCGCPIHEVTRRRLGAVLLRQPKKLARLVHGIVTGSPIPVTVKIRTGESEKKINAPKVVSMLQAAGAAAVTIHGRSMEQRCAILKGMEGPFGVRSSTHPNLLHAYEKARKKPGIPLMREWSVPQLPSKVEDWVFLTRYKKAADWNLIRSIAQDDSVRVPIIGNGDILTHYEAKWRLQDHGCTAVMAGRGALIKPWIFQEFKEGRELQLDVQDRIGVYRQLVAHMKAHFGDDDRGKRKAFYFLPWHFDFFHRYRPLPQDRFRDQSREQPLISTRFNEMTLGEEWLALPPAERVLRCAHADAHVALAELLWESCSDDEALTAITGLADRRLVEWETQLKASASRGAGDIQNAQG